MVVLDEDRQPGDARLGEPLPHACGRPLDPERRRQSGLAVEQGEGRLGGVIDAAEIDPAGFEKPGPAPFQEEVEPHIAEERARRPLHEPRDPG